MQEEFLHYLWKFRLFSLKDLFTQSGELITIIKCGNPNSDSGPDFFNARIRIGKTIWAGNVEIHLRASDWEVHKHHYDKAYNNVILHVVYEADKELKRKNNELIPTLELKNRIPQNIYRKYISFKTNTAWIPCGKQISTMDSFTMNHWGDRLLAERLENKSLPIFESLKQNKNNWEETFYQSLARNFGFKINAIPFEMLARALPLPILAKHRNDLIQIEALLFGVAGLLEESRQDNYANALQKEFLFLKQKFGLPTMDSSLWKFMRLHPPNFPTIRIAQFANIIFKSSHLFSKIIEAKDPATLINLLNCETGEYWQTHYRFHVKSPQQKKVMGKDSVNNILINTIAPFLFVYGKQKNEISYQDRAFELLEKTLPEKNSIIRKWKEIGINAKNAYQTQALLQLKNEYCAQKKCLQCSVGVKLLQGSDA